MYLYIYIYYNYIYIYYYYIIIISIIIHYLGSVGDWTKYLSPNQLRKLDTAALTEITDTKLRDLISYQSVR